MTSVRETSENNSARTTRSGIRAGTSRNQEQNVPSTSQATMTNSGENSANLRNEETGSPTTRTALNQVDKTCFRKRDLENQLKLQHLERMVQELTARNAAHSRLVRSHRREETKMKLHLRDHYILRRLRTT